MPGSVCPTFSGLEQEWLGEFFGDGAASVRDLAAGGTPTVEKGGGEVVLEA